MKRKILMVTVAACLLVLSIAGSSLAYFTDTHTKSNVFTAGNVDIELTYEGHNGKFFPGQEYTSVYASIKNVGSEDAFVGAIITLDKDDLNTILTEAGDDADNIPAAIADVFVGLDSNVLTFVENGDGYIVYVVVEAPLTASNPPVDIFTKVNIPTEWDNNQMTVFNGMNVGITAYATQTVGFQTAEEALKTAFDDWANYPNA